ncbi:NERD domain-containing protein, partial [Patescibacteria group bacterium]|nr:NERD domain-containing protein [Patescibacteria group bacterium]
TLILVLKHKLPEAIGKGGENYVARILGKLDQSKYKIVKDIMIESKGHTKYTQIDIIAISIYGVFCIEVKTFKGWIFGNYNSETWMQVIYRYKHRFYNPFRQNYAHIKAVEALLEGNNIKTKIMSFIVFPNASKIQVSGTNLVGNAEQIVDKILSLKTPIYTEEETNSIYNTLVNANVTDLKIRKNHNKEISNIRRY